MTICVCCIRIGYKDDSCIITGPNFLSTSLRINMNEFKCLHCYETTDPPRDCNRQPPWSHFKYHTSPPKTSPVVSDIMVILNHHAVDDCGFEVHP